MIKIFEDFIGGPKFNIGDFIYCIYTRGSHRSNFKNGVYDELKEDVKYEIENIIKGEKYFLYKLKGLRTPYRENRFISEIEYVSKNYNL